MQASYYRILASILCLCLSATTLSAAESPLYQASGLEATIPNGQSSFRSYVLANETRIRQVLQNDYFALRDAPFGPGYDIDTVLAMRAPYEIRPPRSCVGAGQDTGFLLIHGLTDSPYLLHDIAASLLAEYPCALLRGLLLPGHSTVPGDTLVMRHEDWMETTEYGVNSFRDEVDALYMVGFSTGTTLSLRYADTHRDDALLKGLIMLSPAVAANSSVAFLAPYLRWVKDWLSQHAEEDAARYESFSVNAGAQFYELSKELSDPDFRPLAVPVFMAGSADDSTVNMEAARAFFCTKAPSGQRSMLWYQAQATAVAPQGVCEGLRVLAAESTAHRVVNLAHTSLTMSPDNRHYGLHGRYRICLHYGVDTEDYRQCRDDDAQTVYGETGLASDGRYEGKLVRRGSFNPHYAQMFAAIVDFITSVE